MKKDKKIKALNKIIKGVINIKISPPQLLTTPNQNIQMNFLLEPW